MRTVEENVIFARYSNAINTEQTRLTLKIPTKMTQEIAQKYRLREWLLPRSLIHILFIICSEKELCNPYT